MEMKWLALGVIAGVALCVYLLDQRTRRRASDARSSWHCVRCGVALNPIESSNIAVAGGPIGATQARACPRCSRRDQRIRKVGWVVLLTAFIVTTGLLWLR